MKRLAGSIALVATVVAPAFAASAPAGPEFAANTYTLGRQKFTTVAIDGSGGFVVTWAGELADGSGYGVFARGFDSAGAPAAGESQINSFTTGDQSFPDVAANAAGDFVVVWTSAAQDGDARGVFGRRVDGTGSPLGAEFQINTYATGEQYDPHVALDGAGNFVVVWTGAGEDGSATGVFGRLFDSAGTPVSAEFQVNTTTTSYQQQPAVARGSAGDFVVTWSSFNQDASADAVVGRRFDSTGAPLGGEFQINTYTPLAQYDSSVGLDGSGNFVVVWTSVFQDGSGNGIFGRRFDGAGAPLGGEFLVNSFTIGLQRLSSLAVEDSGSFVVAWSSYYEDGSYDGVFARRFDSAGAPSGSGFQVNTYATGQQYRPSVALAASGDFVVTWSSYGQDGGREGVFGQRFCPDLDGDGLCDAADILVTDPHAGDSVDCSDPAAVQPIIEWDAGHFDKFKVFIATDPGFAAGTVSSGKKLITSDSYTPPAKKWKAACTKALAANPSSPVLFIEVQGVDTDVTKRDPHRKTFSQVVQAVVTP